MSKPNRKGVPLAPWISLGMTEEEFNDMRHEEQINNPPVDKTRQTDKPYTESKLTKVAGLNNNNQFIDGVDNMYLLFGGIGLVLYKLLSQN